MTMKPDGSLNKEADHLMTQWKLLRYFNCSQGKRRQIWQIDVQGVHKVSLQFKKIVKKWNDEISQWGLFYVNQYFI